MGSKGGGPILICIGLLVVFIALMIGIVIGAVGFFLLQLIGIF